jgi:hypothetical protein
MDSAERLRRMRERGPRTETLHRAAARVLSQGIREGWIPESDARELLDAELEGIEVGPERRRLTKAEREEIVSRMLKGDR